MVPEEDEGERIQKKNADETKEPFGKGKSD